jgi:integrase
MRAVAAAQGGAKALRDVALLGLRYALGLCRAEVCALDVASFDATGRRLAVIGKGHTDADWLTVPELPAAETNDYLAIREQPPTGPLFLSLDRAGEGDGRLTQPGLYVVVRALAAAAVGTPMPAKVVDVTVTATSVGSSTATTAKKPGDQCRSAGAATENHSLVERPKATTVTPVR